MTKYMILPPVVSVSVEGGLDVMVASDSARRLADLRGFSPVYQAIIAGTVQALSELVIKTHEGHILQIHGVQDRSRNGIQIACEVAWLAGVPVDKLKAGLKTKLEGLADEISITQEKIPTIEVVIWLTPERQLTRKITRTVESVQPNE